jgi:cell division septation protein DedD
MTANRPFDDDNLSGRGHADRRADPNRADREISIGTPTILGIFFALALVCAAFFGFGYTMGRKSAQSAQATAAEPAPAPIGIFNSPKPSAGSSNQPYVPPSLPTPDASASPADTATVPLNPPSTSTAKDPVAPSDRIIAGEKLPPAAPSPATSSPQPAGSYVVQVAAVTSQDVADILLASLQKKGYTVAVRHEPQDKLLHVQIGPFTDKKEAQAMQARVLADGFNAIVK